MTGGCLREKCRKVLAYGKDTEVCGALERRVNKTGEFRQKTPHRGRNTVSESKGSIAVSHARSYGLFLFLHISSEFCIRIGFQQL